MWKILTLAFTLQVRFDRLPNRNPYPYLGVPVRYRHNHSTKSLEVLACTLG